VWGEQNPIRGFCKELPSKTAPYRDKIEAIDLARNEDDDYVLAYGGAVSLPQGLCRE